MYQSTIRKAKKRTERDDKNRTLVIPEDDQMYGVVKQMLGNGRVKVYCQDEQERNGLICGSMRNRRSRVIIEVGALVVVSHRGYEDKIDVLFRYNAQEVAELVKINVLPEEIVKNMASCDIAGREEEEDHQTIVYGDIDNI
jgi:initiation factor 1A